MKKTKARRLSVNRETVLTLSSVSQGQKVRGGSIEDNVLVFGHDEAAGIIADIAG